MKSKSKIISNIEISYKDEGVGPLIFCFPPFPMSSSAFLPFIESIKDTHRVIAIDLPGFGGYSKFKCKNISLNKLIKSITLFIQSFKIKDYFFLGYSYGGMIALKLMEDGQLKPKKAVLVSTFYDGSEIIKFQPLIKKLDFIEKLKIKNIFNGVYAFLLEYYVKIRDIKKYFKLKDNPEVNKIFLENKTISLPISYKLIKEATSILIRNPYKNIPLLIVYADGDMPFIIKQMKYLSKKYYQQYIMLKNANHRHFFFEIDKSIKKIKDFLNM